MKVEQLSAGEIGTADRTELGVAERDIVTLGIALTAILMFAGTGGAVVPHAVDALMFGGRGPDRLLTSAMLLNIALIIFGWRRYRDLSAEIKERRKAEAQARQLAEIDPLTGCLNRRSIAPATDRLIAGATARGEAAAFIMIDLDNFKAINDLNGHSAGDMVLRVSAERIASVLTDGSLLARLGGDEFACVTTYDPARPDQVDQLAASLIEAVAKPVEVKGNALEVTVSVGVTSTGTGREAIDAGSLLHMADIAMYHAKRHGRNRYAWFENSMEAELRYRSEVENGIRRGIPLGEFVPYYEQQVDISTGELLGFEMLARWNSPTLGLVGPEIFIPIAEEIGLIADLSESVIAQALQDARAWDPKLTLSVNISPIQLRDPWFAQKLLKMLVEANFPPHRLDIEITESSLHENIGTVRSLITSLKNQGIKVSLDDFGTGYASLAHLRTLPFDRIKIDRSFVTSLADDEESATIVKAITSLGEGLGLPITAEGIENEDVLAALLEYGNFKGQGYLYGRPEDAGKTQQRLAEMDLLPEAEAPARKPGTDKAPRPLASNG